MFTTKEALENMKSCFGTCASKRVVLNWEQIFRSNIIGYKIKNNKIKMR